MDTIEQETPLAAPGKPVPKRRSYSRSFKRQIVEEVLDGSVSASIVARRYDINANLLFKWRNQYQQGLLFESMEPPQSLIPIEVAEHGNELATTPSTAGERIPEGSLEITLAKGHRLLVTGSVCPVVLKSTLDVLSS